MPTGYTADIANDITFEEYALHCARAFGALVTLRDDMSAPIPEKFEPSDFYQKCLERAHEQLAKLTAWTQEETALEYQMAFAKLVQEHRDRHARADALRAKYEAMLAQVRAWQAPTPDHTEYKAFMENQILDSMNFDCDNSYDSAPEPQTPAAWRAEWADQLRKDIARYETQHREEVARAHSRTQWINAVRDSFAA